MPELWGTIWKERNAHIFKSKFEFVIIINYQVQLHLLTVFQCNIAIIANDIEATIDFLSSFSLHCNSAVMLTYKHL